MWNPNICDYEYNRACKINVYFDIKNYPYKNCLIAKLLLECIDKIFATTQTSLNDKKRNMRKN